MRGNQLQRMAQRHPRQAHVRSDVVYGGSFAWYEEATTHESTRGGVDGGWSAHRDDIFPTHMRCRFRALCELHATNAAQYGSKKRRLAHPRWTRIENRGLFHDSIPMGSSTFVDSASQASTSTTRKIVLPPESMCKQVQGIHRLVRGCVLLPNVPTSCARLFSIFAWYLPSFPRLHAFHVIPSFPVAAPPPPSRASVLGSAWTSIARGWWCLCMAHFPRACRFVDPHEQQMPSVSPSSFHERQ